MGMSDPFSSGAANSAGYSGASQARRMVRFQPYDYGATELLTYEGEVLRARSRQLVRSNPYAASAEQAWVASICGAGLRPRFPARCKLPEEQQAAVMELWEAWSERCDARGHLDFYGIQAQVASEVFSAGECFLRFRPRRREDGLPVPLQIQTLEAEQLPYRMTGREAALERVHAGVELNALGAPAAYWMLRDHPRDQVRPWRASVDTVRIPADQISHAFVPKRAGQLRGAPVMAPVIVKCYQLMLYDDAELDRKGMAANVFAWTQRAQDFVSPESQADSEGGVQLDMEPNIVLDVPVGNELHLMQMQDIPAAYGEFFRVQLQAISSGLGLTYDQVTGDLSKATFSSSRVGQNEMRRRARLMQQQLLIQKVCRPTWRQWLPAAFLSGAIQDKNYPANAAEYEHVFWQPPKWESVNPVQDAQADKIRVEAGVKSRGQVVRENGEDPDDVWREIEQERASGWTGDRTVGGGGQPGRPPGSTPMPPAARVEVMR